MRKRTTSISSAPTAASQSCLHCTCTSQARRMMPLHKTPLAVARLKLLRLHRLLVQQPDATTCLTVLRSLLLAKALVRQATIVPLAPRRLVFLSKPGTAPLYLHLLVHPPTMAALLHLLCESLKTVTSLHYTHKPMLALCQHTPSTLQSCSLVVCRWARPRRPKAHDHHRPTDSQNTAQTAQQHHTTIIYPEIALHHLANACSRAPIPRGGGAGGGGAARRRPLAHKTTQLFAFAPPLLQHPRRKRNSLHLPEYLSRHPRLGSNEYPPRRPSHAKLASASPPDRCHSPHPY
jgi:hypothetical protein